MFPFVVYECLMGSNGNKQIHLLHPIVESSASHVFVQVVGLKS